MRSIMRKSFFHFFLAGMAIAAVDYMGVEGDDEHAFAKEANDLVEVEPAVIGAMFTPFPGAAYRSWRARRGVVPWTCPCTAPPASRAR